MSIFATKEDLTLHHWNFRSLGLTLFGFILKVTDEDSVRAAKQNKVNGNKTLIAYLKSAVLYILQNYT